ncbi:MAG TPA: NlpC/P60 family protein [Amycolatopsis sp.]|uniref:C40 family peptidase n=1 Tax=Amycolatopsis sp. TaxID=37632 RepID=UPI002B48366A|nr:NlpC/P60 family protein [Amycolatopsis sp.]HKS43698.1 NlpC/P60 family protein [Amycolatopsis sp.]
MFAISVVLVLGAIVPVANAQPPADPATQYQQLVQEAAKADEDLLKAQDDLTKRNAELGQATTEVNAATARKQQAAAAVAVGRVQVDQFASEAFQGGASSSRLSAVISGGSVQDYLERMSALSMIATDRQRSLDALNTALSQAEQARADAQAAHERSVAAADAAATLMSQIKANKTRLDTQIAQLRQALRQLSPAQKAGMGTVKDTGSYLGPPGAANTALQAALAKRGSDYQWAAAGPSEFDCSGLTMWAYKAAGISLPHSSRSQYTLGRPVSWDQMQPGDLVFFDDGSGNPSAIHHVGMYVGSGKMVDAPTEGELVDVRSAKGDGHFIGARRIVG